MKNIVVQTGAIAAFGLPATPTANGAIFDLTSGTTTTAQTLGPSAGETGNIELGATLSLSGSSVAVTISSNNAALTNLAGQREPIYGDATITNQADGLIRGDTDSGIAVIGFEASGHTVTIGNQAGATIRGGGTANAAIEAGS